MADFKEERLDSEPGLWHNYRYLSLHWQRIHRIGVLHLIGLSLLLAYPFLRLKRANIIFGLLFVLLGIYLQNISAGFPWLLWLGVAPPDFYSVDYFPVFPSFGVILVGMGLGSQLYPGYRRRIPVPDISMLPFVKALAFLGRKSLAVYLIHQPVMIAIIYLAGVGYALALRRGSIGVDWISAIPAVQMIQFFYKVTAPEMWLKAAEVISPHSLYSIFRARIATSETAWLKYSSPFVLDKLPRDLS